MVCGAPNAVTGMKSVFAFPGTYIPGKDFVLKDGVGHPRRNEQRHALLGHGARALEDHEGIIGLPDDAPVGMPYVEYARLGGVVFDIAITPNRGDCTGVHGVARDLAAFGLGTLVRTTSIAPQPSPAARARSASSCASPPASPRPAACLPAG